MMSIRSSLSRLFRQTRGQDLLEYALLGSCIAVICLVGVNALGQSLGGLNTSVAGGIVNQG